jgi:pyruvate dehydrogenase E2 component (dihydrolipoamide acetyltransferase)
VARTFQLPDIGEGLTDAEIVAWSVAVGDRVQEGTPLCEIETAKAVVELTAPWPGVILHLGGAAGDTIAVGATLVVIGDAGEAWEPDHQAVDPAAPQPDAASPTGVSSSAGGVVKAMPVVRRLAAELGVDLATVAGTGPGGRITREDVTASANAAPGDTDDHISLSLMRRTIAEHMTRSWTEIPHVTTFDDVDATALLARRRALAAAGRPAALEALLIHAVVPALIAHPEFNATLEGDELMLVRRYNIGVAVDTPDGLIVPVVHKADQLDLEELSAAVTDLSVRARARTLVPSELTGGTFTISNIGALGGGHGTPIIPLGTTAIISFGKVVDRPVVAAESLAIAPVMPLSLSYDHRVIDGGLGRRFVDTLVGELTKEPDA